MDPQFCYGFWIRVITNIFEIFRFLHQTDALVKGRHRRATLYFTRLQKTDNPPQSEIPTTVVTSDFASKEESAEHCQGGGGTACVRDDRLNSNAL